LFVGLCRESNATGKAFFTLTLTDVCSGIIPPTLLEKLKPGRRSFLIRRLDSRLKLADGTGDMQLSYNDYFHEVEMTVFYFSLFPQFHKKLLLYLRLVRQLFWPEKALVLKLGDLGAKASMGRYITARLNSPYFTFRLIGEEIGLVITLLLLVKMIFDTLISLKNYIFRKDSYFDYLRKRNIEPEVIRQVVKNIQ
jgi:hypothetical protein